MYYGNLVNELKLSSNNFTRIIMIIIILNIVSYTTFQFEDYYNNIQRIDIKEIVRSNIVNNLEKEFINNPKEIITGEKLTNLLKTQELVVSWYSNLKEYVIPYLFTFITTCWYFFTIDASLLIGMLFLLLSIIVIIFSCVLFCNQYHTKTNDDYVKIYTATEEYLSNIMTIFTHNQIGNEISKIKELDNNYNKSYRKSVNCILLYGLLGVVLMTLCLLYILYKSYQLLKMKKIDTSTFVGLYFVTVGLLEKLIWMSNIFHNMSTNYSNLNNLVCKYDDEQNKNFKRMSPEKFKSIHETVNKQSNIIEIRNLSFKYKDTKNYIFQNLNISIKDGERVSLVGEIGKGKSTLLKIILGLLKPTSGEIYLNNIEYQNYNQSEIFSNFGYMTQNPTLFNRSILDNILFGVPNTTRKQVEELLDVFDLKSVFNKFQNGIDTSVGKNGSLLSGGQKQIIWFLRIYLRQPNILLLDEPTASLNLESKERLWKLIDKGFKGKTIIVASHDDFLISKVQRKIKIN